MRPSFTYFLLSLLQKYSLITRGATVPITFGIFVGLLLGGIFLNFEGDSFDVEHKKHKLIKYPLVQQADTEAHSSIIIWLRCVVLMHESTDVKVARKAIEAIKDTYAPNCNDMLFFSNSAVLVREFSGK